MQLTIPNVRYFILQSRGVIRAGMTFIGYSEPLTALSSDSNRPINYCRGVIKQRQTLLRTINFVSDWASLLLENGGVKTGLVLNVVYLLCLLHGWPV